MSFDIDTVCSVLQRLQSAIGAPPGTEPLRTAALALHFIWGSGHQLNFEDFLDCFHQSDSQTSSFDTRAQAETSLQQPMDPRRAHGMAIAGTRYSVSYSLERGARFLVRVPERAELTMAHQPPSLLMSEALAALRQARTQAHSSQDKDAVDTALLALQFISESGQSPLFENFLGSVDSRDLPRSLCSFGTRQEADTWLSAHPRPPHGAQVEISGERYSVGYSRDGGVRALVRVPPLDE
ncbi:hypothetical protein F0U61_25290 [Archangium violaceum]|uniref:hypothetical protein n=1 Tax=Archangium violaceum TaxID=83451 RepID=UPI002B2A1CFE|nr:hypothetical protein F0U61_25290 [Archangium violaceum]